MIDSSATCAAAFDVFVSYSHVDKTTADAACAMLEREGIRCWIAPRDIIPGDEWGGAIVKAIDRCRVMVLIFSANANSSKQIRREVERAVHAGVTIIPVRIENVVPTEAMAYFMSTVHWLDAMNGPMEAHLQRLADSIKGLLVPAPLSAPAADSTAQKAASPPEPSAGVILAKHPMFQEIMNFDFQRTGKQAFGWYLMYLLISVVLGFAAGRIAAITIDNFEEAARVGLIAGQLAVIPYCIALGVMLLWNRAKSAANVMLVLLAIILSIIAGGLGGLIPLAFMTRSPTVKPLPHFNFAYRRI